jgi:hypothetical protein
LSDNTSLFIWVTVWFAESKVSRPPNLAGGLMKRAV